MDCSLPGSSAHGIFQARILEWVAISFSRGSSQPRDWTQVSRIVSRCFYRLSHQGSPSLLLHLCKWSCTNWNETSGVSVYVHNQEQSFKIICSYKGAKKWLRKKIPKLWNKKPEMCRSITRSNTRNLLLHNIFFLLVSMVDKFSFTVFKEKLLLKT